MAVESKVVIQQLDAALREAEKIGIVRYPGSVITEEGEAEPRSYATGTSDQDVARANVILLSALKKYAPPASPHVDHAEAVLKQGGLSNDWCRGQLIGIVQALRYEYASGALQSIAELVHADLFTDFLQMARHQAEKGFKDPGAVIAAGVFEQHLRRLATKNNVSVTKENGDHKSAEAINQDLTKAGAYDIANQKEVTALLAFRNSAAHGEWDKYDAKQVALFIDRVAFFMQKNPA